MIFVGLALPRVATACVGDCDGDERVTVDEIVRGVVIALGTEAVDSCVAFDSNDDEQVTVDEILTGVRYALDGCPAVATPTPPALPTSTPSPPPDTATPTAPPTGTATHASTNTPLPTATPVATDTPPPTSTRSATATFSHTATRSCTPTPTSIATATPTRTASATQTATATATRTAAPPESTTPSSPTPTPGDALPPEFDSGHPGASILVFPEVVNDGTTDSLVQIVNLSGSIASARCSYVDARPTFPGQPGPANPPRWTVTDFVIRLLPRQPTHWVASRGRPFDPTSDLCSATNLDCDGAGVDPASDGVPPVPTGFTGFLICVETLPSGRPLGANSLVGLAATKDLGSGDLTKVRAIGLAGRDDNDGDDVLCLGAPDGDACAITPDEYEPCPSVWEIDHAVPFTADPVGGAGTLRNLRITVLPCAIDLATPAPATIDLSVRVRDDFGTTFTAAATVRGWQRLFLAEISPLFASPSIAGSRLMTEVRSADGKTGFVLLANEFRAATGQQPSTAAAAWNATGHDPAASAPIRLPQ